MELQTVVDPGIGEGGQVHPSTLGMLNSASGKGLLVMAELILWVPELWESKGSVQTLCQELMGNSAKEGCDLITSG